MNKKLPLFVVLWMAMAVTGCVEVNGGAVEVGWDLRFPDGKRTDSEGNDVNCAKARLSRMRLMLIDTATGADPCVKGDHCRFDCEPIGFGTTAFVIPEGQYSMSIRIEDLQSKLLAPADGIITPGTVVRNVHTGEITSLNVNLIIVERPTQ